MKTFRILFFLVVFFPLSIFAQDDKYDAVYENSVKEFTLNPDGSMDFRYIRKLKLQTYRAFHSLYGETFIVYDTNYQKLKINEVYTLMADGKKVITPENAFNPSLPGFAANAPDYNALREMVITHTGLEKGAIIYLDYQIHTNKDFYPFLMGNELLAENEPVRSLEVKIRIPSGKELHYKVLNSEEKLDLTRENGFLVYTMKKQNIPAISSEDYQPGGYSAYPRLIFSTEVKMEEACKWLTGKPAFQFICSDDMKEKVARFLQESHDPADLVMKIQELVVDKMKLYPVPMSIALFRCRTPEQTWKSNGGTVPEKALLMMALLKQAGIDVRPGFITKSSFVNKSVVSLLHVEDICIVADLKEKGVWYLSPHEMNTLNLKYSLAERTFIILDSDGNIQMEDTESPPQMVKVNGNFIVSSDPKMTGEVSIYLEGQAYPRYALSRDKFKIRNLLSGQLIKNDSIALKKSALNNENGYQVYTVQTDKPFRKDTNLCFFRLPVISSGVDSWNMKAMSLKRESAFEIPAKADESYNYSFILPAGTELFIKERKISIKNNAGSYEFEIKTGKGKAEVRRSIKFSETICPAENYPDLKALLDGWNNPWNRQVVFRVK